jgi:hypothetical protein
MGRVRVRLRLQESGGAKLDHDAGFAWSDRRFELYNSRAFLLFFAAILASVAVFFFSLLFALFLLWSSLMK